MYFWQNEGKCFYQYIQTQAQLRIKYVCFFISTVTQSPKKLLELLLDSKVYRGLAGNC